MTFSPPVLPAQNLRLHIVGIAGVGMNAVAQVMQAIGYPVSGSDRSYDQGLEVPVLRILATAGIRMFSQDGAGVGPDTGAVIVSSAIEPDNPDLMAAQRLGIPVWHRAAALAAAALNQRVCAIAGTSGKTTVTGMVGWILTAAGMDPTVINGGALVNWRSDTCVGNVRMGQGDRWIVEVDESDRSLLCFRPEWAAITNISRDHFSLPETIDLFQSFADQVHTGLCGGPGVRDHIHFGARRYQDAGDIEPLRSSLQLIGEHNLQNAALAVTLCEAIGVPRAAALEALKSFQGIERRLEAVGQGRGVMVYDDVAHNTAKMEAAWSAVASTQPGKVLAVWRPHGYGPLAAMAEDLVEMFVRVCRPQDRLYLLPVFYAGGTARRLMESAGLVRRLVERGVPACSVDTYADLEVALWHQVTPGDAVLCMGARDPHIPVFARHLVHRLATE